jgi:hypothetical protein
MVMRREFLMVASALTGLFFLSYFESLPVKALMDWRSKRNALAEMTSSHSDYDIYDYAGGMTPSITIDFLKGKYFWHPQVAIWIEDSKDRYLGTLSVTTSTAKGLFYAGRSAENFMISDEVKREDDAPTRRVDALPYWSHKRGYRYEDGLYTPPSDQPLPDAITMATPKYNFYAKMSPAIDTLSSFQILVEVNVAFDENEYYSEYDFPEDSLYHSGTGLLGQPSLIYGATITNTDKNHYYILSLLGRGHHSGSTGDLIQETNTVSTAKYIVERIVVGVDELWYKK